MFVQNGREQVIDGWGLFKVAEVHANWMSFVMAYDRRRLVGKVSYLKCKESKGRFLVLDNWTVVEK